MARGTAFILCDKQWDRLAEWVSASGSNTTSVSAVSSDSANGE